MLQRGKVRVIPTERVQAVFDAFDSSLKEEWKAEHPIEPFEVITGRVPNEWVALVPTQIGAGLKIIAARLVAHAPKRDALDEKLKSLQTQHPELKGVTITFTGLHPWGRKVAIA